MADEPQIISGDRVRSRAEIHARSRRAAAGFRELGISEGDAVALLLRNDIAFFEAAVAAPLAGAYPVPINWHMSADDIACILRDGGAKLLVAGRPKGVRRSRARRARRYANQTVLDHARLVASPPRQPDA